MPGPLALVGSGEYLPVMAPIDRRLLEGRAPRVAMLPTAAGAEAEERIEYWNELGRSHFRSLGVEAVAVPVLERKDAFSKEFAATVEGAGLIYLSGGSPSYLAETLRDSLVFDRIVQAWMAGAALAGCSAGACALTAVAGGFRHPRQMGLPGLGLIDHLAVIPHFDRFDRRSAVLVSQVLEETPENCTLVGIDERTALVANEEAFEVMGEQSVWWIDRDGTRHAFSPGTRLVFPPGQAPVVVASDSVS